jgi:hypothetical protein
MRGGTGSRGHGGKGPKGRGLEACSPPCWCCSLQRLLWRKGGEHSAARTGGGAEDGAGGRAEGRAGRRAGAVGGRRRAGAAAGGRAPEVRPGERRRAAGHGARAHRPRRVPGRIRTPARGVARHPKNVDVLYYLGIVAGRLAGEELERMVQVAPDSGRVHQVIAESLELQGRRHEAATAYARRSSCSRISSRRCSASPSCAARRSSAQRPSICTRAPNGCGRHSKARTASASACSTSRTTRLRRHSSRRPPSAIR